MGVAIGIVDVIDCRPGTEADDGAAMYPASGHWAWVLASPRRLPPVPVTGRLGIFTLDAHITRLLQAT